MPRRCHVGLKTWRRHGGAAWPATQARPLSWVPTCRPPQAQLWPPQLRSWPRCQPRWRPGRRQRCRCPRRQSGRGRRVIRRWERRWRCRRWRRRWGPGSLRSARAGTRLHPPLRTRGRCPAAAGAQAARPACPQQGRLRLPAAAGRPGGWLDEPWQVKGVGSQLRQAAVPACDQGWKLPPHAVLPSAAKPPKISASARVTCYRESQLRPLAAAGGCRRRVPAASPPRARRQRHGGREQ